MLKTRPVDTTWAGPGRGTGGAEAPLGDRDVIHGPSCPAPAEKTDSFSFSLIFQKRFLSSCLHTVSMLCLQGPGGRCQSWKLETAGCEPLGRCWIRTQSSISTCADCRHLGFLPGHRTLCQPSCDQRTIEAQRGGEKADVSNSYSCCSTPWPKPLLSNS